MSLNYSAFENNKEKTNLNTSAFENNSSIENKEPERIEVFLPQKDLHSLGVIGSDRIISRSEFTQEMKDIHQQLLSQNLQREQEYRKTIPIITPETLEKRKEWKDEGIVKETIDTLYLGGVSLLHNSKNFFLSAVPNFLYGQKEVTEEMSQGERTSVEVENAVNKYRTDKFRSEYIKSMAQHKQWLEDNPDLKPKPGWEGGALNTIKMEGPGVMKDPAFWSTSAANTFAYTASVMATTLGVTALTGNPIAGMAAGVLAAVPSQSQDLYEDLIMNGATEEEAADLSVKVGPAIALVEVLGDLPILSSFSKPFQKLLYRNIKKEISKNILSFGAKKFLEAELSETLEEVVQTAMQNATVKTVNENRSLLEGIDSSIVDTLISTIPFSLFSAGTDIKNIRTLEKQQKLLDRIKELGGDVTEQQKQLDIAKSELIGTEVHGDTGLGVDLLTKESLADEKGAINLGAEIGEGEESIKDAKKAIAEGKSAEEFVEAQGTPVYRGDILEPFDPEKISPTRGISVTDSKSLARDFAEMKKSSGQEEEFITELFISPKANILQENKLPNNLVTEIKKATKEFFDQGQEDRALEKLMLEKQQNIIDFAKENNFDGVRIPALSENLSELETVILNKEVLKTKSQLTDIYNKANKN